MKTLRKWIVLPALLVSAVLSAQEVKSIPVSMDDFLAVLDMSGYSFYSFDLSAFSGKNGKVDIVCQTWEDQKLVSETSLTSFPGRSVRTMTVAVVPAQEDSLARLTINVPGETSLTRFLNRKPLLDGRFYYFSRPFKAVSPDLKKPGFIPILLYGSGWIARILDAPTTINVLFEKEIDPAQASDRLKYCPHYYILGLRYETK